MNPGGAPKAGSPSPSLGQGRGSVDRSVDGCSGELSNVATIGGAASRDATARRRPAAQGPVRCASSARGRASATQDSRSPLWRRGRLVVRFRAASCCRSARFSKTNSRWPRSANARARPITMSSFSMRRSWLASAQKSTRTSFGEGLDEKWLGGRDSSMLPTSRARRGLN
jgi:hypothetical protein